MQSYLARPGLDTPTVRAAAKASPRRAPSRGRTDPAAGQQGVPGTAVRADTTRCSRSPGSLCAPAGAAGLPAKTVEVRVRASEQRDQRVLGEKHSVRVWACDRMSENIFHLVPAWKSDPPSWNYRTLAWRHGTVH